MTPQHHERPMYRDWHDNENMHRWLCTEPGCNAVIGDTQFAAMQDLAFATEHGIQLPGATIINFPPAPADQDVT